MNIACYIRGDAVFRQVEDALARAGFECARFACETTLLRSVRKGGFDMILIEVDNEPVAEGRMASWLSCRDGESTPVVLLSSLASPEQIVKGLEAGADDFIEAPFDAAEFVARVHMVLRSYARRGSARTIELNGFELERDTYTLRDRGTPVELTPREFSMAWLFFSAPGTYLSRDTISTSVWGVDSEIASRTIEQHVYKLRKKLNLGSARGVRIRTAYTRGYRLELCDPHDDGRDDVHDDDDMAPSEDVS